MVPKVSQEEDQENGDAESVLQIERCTFDFSHVMK